MNDWISLRIDLWISLWINLWTSQGVTPDQTAQMIALAGAAALDYAVGDPWGWPHPVQVIGKAISLYSKWALRRSRSALSMRALGVGLALSIITLSSAVSWIGLELLGRLSPELRIVGECVLLASCFAGRSLRQAALDVLAPLQNQAWDKARQALAMYVGRDTDSLDEAQMYRAILETVSENAVDGVLAPLFYAILGASIGLAGPVAIAYKAASTLDSMVGYRREPYRHLGWFSARLEDVLTWLPCRISVLSIALLSARPARVIKLCRRDANADPSPNAGWSECAYAAALGVQLGGPNTYRGKPVIKPLLGEATRPITPAVIASALTLTRRGFLIGLSVGIGAIYIF